MKEEVLRVDKVTLKKDGVVILDNINFHIFKGEIMGIIFLTAHGEKELIRLLCTNTPITYGRIYYKNELVDHYENSTLSYNPIHVIGQSSRLISNLTVADNIFVMRHGLKKYIINRKQLRNQFYLLFKDLNCSLDPDKLILELTNLERCLVELLRAIVANCKLIIIYGISSFLNPVELAEFNEYIRFYNQKGVSFLYIAKDHQEVFRISHRAALMQHARILKILEQHELTEHSIIPYTISFDVKEEKKKSIPDEGILTFTNVTTQYIKDLSFSIQKGECVLLLDKSNNLCNDFLKLMSGKITPDSGQIYYNNHLYSKQNGSKAVENRILTINKNPVKTMLFWEMSYIDNLYFLIDQKLGQTKIKPNMKHSILEEYKSIVGKEIYTQDLNELELRSLYNLIYYRVHLFNPNILICVQPFTGVDMYLKKHILDLLFVLKKRGITIILMTVSIADHVTVADRVLVLDDDNG